MEREKQGFFINPYENVYRRTTTTLNFQVRSLDQSSLAPMNLTVEEMPKPWNCGEFVGQVDLRRFYCFKVSKVQCMHRDIMADRNICDVIQGHLLVQQRPLYLQSQDSDGNYP